MVERDRAPVVDHHCHLSPTGEGVAAARRFRDLGGTHLFLATQNYSRRLPRTVAHYDEQFTTTEELARRIVAETGVGVFVVVAPYPVDLIGQAEELGVVAAVELQKAALDLAGRRVEAERAIALGEVGRPHFPVSAEIRDAADEVFRHALGVARDAGCPAVVHSEDLSAEGYRELAATASRASFPVGKLVKHYARSPVTIADRGGVVPSYVARRDLVAECLEGPAPWFLETDFLDDPARPGAVLDLATVPRRAEAIRRARPDGADLLRVPFEESVRTVYGLELAVSGGAV